MKKSFFCLIAIAFVLFFSSCLVHERYVVRERPTEIVYVRPAPPSADHIWVTGDWRWSNHNYRWEEGHWERRHPGLSWHNGYWKQTRHGWQWFAGHWG